MEKREITEGEIQAPAKVVLGPVALERLFINLLTNFKRPEVGVEGHEAAYRLSNLFAYIDYEKQVVIETGSDAPGGIEFLLAPKSEAINEKAEGVVFMDAVEALAQAVNDDLAGFVLRLINAKWQRSLTLEETEEITAHLNALINLLTN